MKDLETNKYLHKYLENDNKLCKICNTTYIEHHDSGQDAELQEEEIRLNIDKQIIEKEPQKTIKKIQFNISKSILDDFENPNICRICFNKILDSNSKVSFSCTHEFCNDCVKNYLSSLIEEGKVIEIRCLYGGCPRKFTNEEIKKNVAPEIWLKYRKFYYQKLNMKGPEYKNCPYPDCDEIVQVDPLEIQIFNECDLNHRFCSKCMEVGWHSEGRCEKVI